MTDILPARFKKFSFRTSLLLTSALLLVTSCDQKSDDETSQNVLPEDGISLYANPDVMEVTPPPTLSGDFLAGQFAQNHADWARASDYLSGILDETPDSKDISSRVMALDMGSGHYDKSIAIARKIMASPSGEADTTLARLICAIADFKNGKYQIAVNDLSNGQKEIGGMGATVLPLLQAWADAGQGKTNVAVLKGHPSLLYQAVLIAAYNKDEKAIANLANDYNYTRTSIPVGRLEDIAEIFTAFNQKEEARDIYRAIQTAIPQKADELAEKIKKIDEPTTPPTPGFQFPTPQTAMSQALFDMAQIFSIGYPETAQLFAHMALYLDNKNNRALEILADISAQNKLYQTAISYLSRIDTQNDANKKIVVHRQIAALTEESGQTDEAIRILKEIGTVDTQIQIGDIYRKHENFKDALDAYNAAYIMLDNKITPQYWDLSFSRGMVNERLKNWDQAEKDLQTALLHQPDQPYVLNYLGYSWADQGRNLDKAAEMVEKAARLKPDDGAIIDSLGWVYFRMGKFDKAVATLEKAVELAPTESEINDHLGDSYWQVGRKSEARFQWTRALSFSKDEALNTKIQEKIQNGLWPVTAPPAAPDSTAAAKK